MSSRPLTEKQRRFVEAYMGESRGNATDAAPRAGYVGSDATLAMVGNENLRKPKIRDAIQARQEEAPPNPWARGSPALLVPSHPGR